jgi:hypothetical protein
MFLRELLNDPKDFLSYSRWQFTIVLYILDAFAELSGGRLSGAIIMDVTYGIDAFDKNDSYISNADEIVRIAGTAGLAGTHMVDFISARECFNNLV